MAYLLLIFGIIGLDQCTKWIVQLKIDLYSSVELWNFIKLTYIENNGAAFGILEDNRLIFIGFTLVIIAVVLVLWKKPWMKIYHLPASLIVAGAAGNCIDRVFRGVVVDFIDFTYWPVFNVADISVCCGTVLLALMILFGKDEAEVKQKNGREKKKKS